MSSQVLFSSNLALPFFTSMAHSLFPSWSFPIGFRATGNRVWVVGGRFISVQLIYLGGNFKILMTQHAADNCYLGQCLTQGST
ncbi:hypothetical protein B0H14DRAFT_151794 [Mycena olivaceomarginata]|nr:hypothetical protein B0H14DRAFT_151794 [Mycena olivaceomarginata]